MMNIRNTPVLVLLLLAACAHTTVPAPVEQAESDHVQAADTAVLAVQPAEEPAQDYPKIELTGQMLYQFLLSDIAAQRGHPELAIQGYLDLAKSTRDLRVVRRAAQLAYESRQMDETIEAFKLWNALDPKAALPKQMLTTVYLSGGMLTEAKPFLVDLLAADPSDAGHVVVQVYPLLARNAGKEAVYQLLVEVTRPYLALKQEELHWVLAQAASAAGHADVALAEARKARAIRPDWEMAVLLEAQQLHASDPQQAMQISRDFLAAHDDANELRMYYARLLLERKQYEASRAQFRELLKHQPGNADVAFAIALLSIQMGELDKAESELKQTLAVGGKDPSTVHFYLAQLQEAKKDDAAAMAEYQKITEGEYVFQSRLRMAYLLAKQKKLTEAGELLHATKARNSQQRAQLVLTEAQLLRDAKKYDQAFKVVSKGLEQQPNQPDLLYEAGMIADKLGKFDVTEKMLKQLIKVAPSHAHAYNALGYAMMERRERLPEAMQLVEKAYQLAPDDAAIMDSMGWGYYLTGNLSKSLEFMRRAYAAYRDPEIAAHLGEVLWQSGSREEAKKVWQQSLLENPGNPVLQSVMNRLMH